MDVIISANDKIKRMIKEIQLDEDYKISPEKFKDTLLSIVKGKEKDEV